MNIKKPHSVRHKALLSYIIVFDSTYKVLEFKVEEATEGLSGTVIYSIFLLSTTFERNMDLVFLF